ncbi:heat-inducible transcriptional repressor HrcA [Harryflintia acetispora]|uniref:heat-inducible transcriptional repressor HrcA n=1 Tax=Harryflintia acetispora TaxID=1849041 RepID=UPI001404BC46|nr:heat-inducible transcriptional repressor HrcA [Harryflintia acetispora]
MIAVGLDARKGRILAAIVSQYIQTGEPVGSKSICDLEGINVSSATVRNEMAALFDMGLLEQPHTSAGRIPSHLGYRVYIDSLMRCDPLTQHERDELDALFNVGDPDPDRLIEDATERLAQYTGCATVSATMTARSVYVKRVGLIKVDETTVVILVMANNGVIKNKVVRVGFRVTQDICDFFTNFANGMLRGKSLYEISLLYLNSVAVSLGEYSRLLTPLLAAIYELCKEIYDGQFYRRGETNLLSYHELEAAARELFTLLESRERVTELLYPQGSLAPGVKVAIGKENREQELCDTALIVARYRIGSDSAGAIGIIGPVRLPYPRLIPHLEYFANTLGKLLSDTYRSEASSPQQ